MTWRKYQVKSRGMNRIEEVFKQSVQHRMTLVKTPAEKREIIREANPLFYALGEHLTPPKPYEVLYVDS